jgi:hypothetical protein
MPSALTRRASSPSSFDAFLTPQPSAARPGRAGGYSTARFSKNATPRKRSIARNN